jgi:dGTP triphosphohydrolase
VEVPGFDPAEKPLHRAVCDFIAGMTDRYFFRIYEEHFRE